jgi:hypothetical protein
MDASEDPAIDLGELVNGQTINISDYPELSIQAITIPAADDDVQVDFTESVIKTDGKTESDDHTAKDPPYGVQKTDSGGKFEKSKILQKEGQYTVTATIYNDDTGETGNTITLSLNLAK